MISFFQILLPLILCLITLPLSGQIHPDPNLETVASFGKSMAIGVSVNSKNQVFVAFPGHNGDGSLALAEIKNGDLIPYPDKTWNSEEGDYGNHFLRIQDLYVDTEDCLWVLDSKPSSGRNVFKDGKGDHSGLFKLVKINTRTREIERVYLFEDLNKEISALNDVRIDNKRGYAYFSDPGQAALVVMNLETGRTRTVLKNTEFTTADNLVPTYDSKEMRTQNGKSFVSHVNGIALTRDSKYFYFKPINKKELYRMEARFLSDENLNDADLMEKIEIAGYPGITHGLIADGDGNIYLTTSESFSISYRTPDGKIKILVRDPRLLWPDSLGIGTDGCLYFSCAQIQRLPSWNNGTDMTEYPYRLYRVKLPVR